MTDDDAAPRVSAALKKTLDGHGFPFQHAVVRYCEELFYKKASRWVFEVAEFPVSTNGADARIDFVLYVRSRYASDPGAYLVCECKRPNPVLGHWAFVRSPYWRGKGGLRSLVFEGIKVESSSGRLFAAPRRLFDSSEPYDLGVELKGAAKGEATGLGRGAIEDAATQVCRGVGGLVDFFKDNPRLVDGHALVIPVIFTTAQLYVSPVDLGAADLTTGTLPDGVSTSESPWLWFQYNLSSSLRHNAPKEMPDGGLASLGSVLEYQHARSIAMVSPSGIESFLRQMPDKLAATDMLRP